MAFSKPAPRYGHVAVAIGHHQFTWGGGNENRDKSLKELARTVEVFDLSKEQWEKRPTHGSPAPPGYLYPAYTTIGSSLYSFGGWDGHSRYNTLHRLDLSSLEWKEVVPRNPSAAPKARSACGMVSFQDSKLVVFAGFTRSESTDDFHVFDIQEGLWSSPPTTGDKPPPCAGFTLTKIDDYQAVMFGGYTGGHRINRINDVFILELGNWHWTKLEVSGPSPPGRNSHAACCLAGPLTGQEHPLLMVVGGGSESGKAFNDGWILDVDQKRWTKVDLPGEMQPRSSHTVTVFGSAPGFRQLVLYGGMPPMRALDSSEVIAATTLVTLELQGGKWKVAEVIREDQLGRRAEERLRERMEKLWPSLPHTEQTSHRAEEGATTLEKRLREAESRTAEAEKRPTEQKVRLAQLQVMRTPKGEKVEIIKSLAVDWKSFGVLLDFDADGTTLNLIEAEQKSLIASCREMFQKWLTGSGRQPATWGILIELLEDAEHKYLAGQIKQALGL